MNVEALRGQQREEWTRCAPGWRRYRANFARPSWPITGRMLALAGTGTGDRVLDLACGNGNPTFDLAELVGPDGYVLGLDLAPAMIDAARAWAVRCHVSNVEFRVIPDERRLGVPPGSFDAATCRAGIQYMPEREAAARAVRDALRPGGRFVVMTLGAPALCQPFTLTNDVVARHAELPWRDPDDPGPVGLSTVEQLAEILVAAGFVDVKTETLISPIFEADSPAEAWRLFTETAGPFMELLASLDRQRRRALDRDAVAAFAAAFPGGRVRPTGQALIACGVKPA